MKKIEKVRKQVRNNLGTNDNIRKIETGQDDDYGTAFLLDYP